MDRIRSFDPKVKIIGEFDMAAHRHWLYAMVEFVPEHDSRTEDEFDSEWKQDREARRALIKQVKRLADLAHPPRAARLGSAENWAGLLGGPDPACGT